MTRIRDVVIDSRHPASLARFWAAVLEVEASSRGTPRLFFQLVPESKLVKNRVHLDLACADVAAEVERLAGLGARVLAEQEGWVTMADPEGNEFDVTPD
ncbi:MAG: VOC family protein [Streptosporangiaceae bacterium]